MLINHNMHDLGLVFANDKDFYFYFYYFWNSSYGIGLLLIGILSLSQFLSSQHFYSSLPFLIPPLFWYYELLEIQRSLSPFIHHFGWEFRINSLLLNSLNFFHPPIFFIISFLTIYGLFKIIKISNVFLFFIFYKRLNSHNLRKLFQFTFSALLALLGLGGWWANQEGTWGGWWNCDPSEFAPWFTGFSLLTILHLPIRLFFSRSSTLIYLFLAAFNFLIFFFLQLNFSLLSHNFGLRFIFFFTNSFFFELLLCLTTVFIVFLLRKFLFFFQLQTVSALLSFKTFWYEFSYSYLFFFFFYFFYSMGFILNYFLWNLSQTHWILNIHEIDTLNYFVFLFFFFLFSLGPHYLPPFIIPESFPFAVLFIFFVFNFVTKNYFISLMHLSVWLFIILNFLVYNSLFWLETYSNEIFETINATWIFKIIDLYLANNVFVPISAPLPPSFLYDNFYLKNFFPFESNIAILCEFKVVFNSQISIFNFDLFITNVSFCFSLMIILILISFFKL